MNCYQALTVRQKRTIWYFILVFSIIPILDFSGLTSVFNRNIPVLAGNYNLICLVLSLPLVQRIRNFKGMKLPCVCLYILLAYTFYEFVSSALATSFYLTLQVFRRSFMGPLNMVLLLPFLLNRSGAEIEYLWRSIFKVMIAFGLVYISNNLGVDWIGVKSGLGNESHGGYSVNRSIIGLPPIESIWLALTILAYCIGAQHAGKWLAFFLLLLFLSFTRNLFLCSCVCLFAVSLMIMSKGLLNIGKVWKLLFFICSGLLVMSIVYPSGVGFWFSKLFDTFNDELVNETGTFAVREGFVDLALEYIAENMLTGIGYIRDAPVGSYSIAMSGDSYYAAILYAEGIGGVVLRSTCYLSFCIVAYYHFKRLPLKMAYMDIVIIVTTLSCLANYIQTKLFTHFTLFFGMMVVIWLKQYYQTNDSNSEYNIYCI